MASMVFFASVSLSLSGNRWHIQAGDADAARVINALGETMSLLPAGAPTQQESDEPCRVLLVSVDPGLGGPATGGYEAGPVFCHLPPPENHDLLVIGMSLVAQAIARAELSRGGFLVHGALAQTPGGRQGIILAGPGTVGKTTASNRLPLPWRSLSDDTTLVLRDGRGQYMAHPWPTWSRFFRTPDGEPGPGGTWAVQNGLRLRSIFFLAQAAEDRIAPLATTPAVAYLMQTMQHVTLQMTPDLPADQTRALHRQQLAAAEELVRTIPAATLLLSLTGTFWKLIEETLVPVAPTPLAHAEAQEISQDPGKGISTPLLFHDDRLAVTYYGPSMNPTLRHPDLLEVVPYGSNPIRRGDVVYYLPPTGGAKVIHRVVRVTAKGICTRGDSNSTDDPYLLQLSDVIGRVTAAWRHDRRRKIAGGPGGIWSGYRARLSLRLNSLFSPLLHGLYHTLAANRLLRRILPASQRPRVFEFRQGYQPSILKLMVRGQVIGRYNPWQKRWEIDRPWRLLVDAAMLPVVDFSPAKHAPALPDAANSPVPEPQP